MDLLHVQILELVHQLRQLRAGQRTSLAEQQNAFTEDHESRDGADSQGFGDLRLIFGVDLGEGHIRVVRGFGFKYRSKGFAGPAPGRPEIHDQRFVGVDRVLERVLVQINSRHGRWVLVKMGDL